MKSIIVLSCIISLCVNLNIQPGPVDLSQKYYDEQIDDYVYYYVFTLDD